MTALPVAANSNGNPVYSNPVQIGMQAEFQMPFETDRWFAG
jgi:hypothetical protein